MAIVDSLLKLVAVRGADALVLRSGQVPALLKSDAELSLTMPVPGADVLNAILREITDDGERELLSRDGRVRTHYRAADKSRFTADVRAAAGGHHIVFRAGHAAIDQPERPSPAPASEEPPSAPRKVSGALSAAETAGAPVRSAVKPAARDAVAGEPVAAALAQSRAAGASDVFLAARGVARMRVAGRLKEIDGSHIGEQALLDFLQPSMSEADAAALAASGSCDVAITSGGSRYRVNLFKQLHGLSAAFRPIRSTPPRLSELNLPKHFHQLTRHRSGLVLMVGTAGSGKSTTLAALIEHLNVTADKHIITLEDPIEYLYSARRCLIQQRELGAHVESFSAGLRAALRESPDVILVGEMRDHATIAAALTAAETGHLVLSTLHSGSAAMAVDRMIDVFPHHQQQQVRYQLAEVLRAVVTQHLLPGSRPGVRVPAYEKLEVTRAVSTKIREQRTHQIETELQRGMAEGMVPLERSLAELVARGLLPLARAHEHAGDGVYLDQLIRDAR